MQLSLLFLKAHHGLKALIMAGLLAVAQFFLAGNTVELPQMLQGITRPIDVSLILALPFAPLTVYAFGNEALHLETLARRSLAAGDAALTAVLLGPVALTSLIIVLGGDRTAGLAQIRNSAAFLAMALALLSIASAPLAAGLPMVYFLAAATLGLGGNGSPAWWAWIRTPATPATTALALVGLSFAIVVFHLYARRQALVRGVPEPEFV